MNHILFEYVHSGEGQILWIMDDRLSLDSKLKGYQETDLQRDVVDEYETMLWDPQ